MALQKDEACPRTPQYTTIAQFIKCLHKLRKRPRRLISRLLPSHYIIKNLHKLLERLRILAPRYSLPQYVRPQSAKCLHK